MTSQDDSHERSPLLSQRNRTSESGEPERHDNENGSASQIDEELADSQLIVILSGVFLGAFVAALDSTLVATLAAPISNSFNDLPLLGWLASSFFIANTIIQPLSGKLTDIYGRRNGLALANFVFAIGNLICAVAQREWVLILGRVVAGLGGGGIYPITAMVMSDIIPLRRRGMWQGIGNICYGFGSGIGGPFGGWLSDALGWRWAFVVQIPITAVAIILIFLKVNVPVTGKTQSKSKKLDWLGATLLTVSLVLMLVGLICGGNTLPWTHPLILSVLPTSALGFVAFVIVEAKYAEDPIIPVGLFKVRTVTAACLTTWLMSLARFALLFYAPIFFQLQGYSASATGLRFVPESVGIAVCSISCGLIMRRTGRYYALSIGMQSLFVVGLGLIATLMLDTPAWPPFLYLLAVGMGFSGMLTTTIVGLLSSVDQKEQAVITSAVYTFRSTGTVIGITIASVVFQNILRPRLGKRLSGEKNGADIAKDIERSLRKVQELHPPLKQDILDIYMAALRAVFITLLGIGILGLIIGSTMREHKLHKRLSRSSSQERLNDDQETRD